MSEENPVNVKQRLTGAAILIAFGVIFLPLLFDGAGKDQHEFVYQGIPESPPPPQSRALKNWEDGGPQTLSTAHASVLAPLVQDWKKHVASARDKAEEVTRKTLQPEQADVGKVQSWAVQVGSFGEHENALTVQNRLREAGLPAYIQEMNHSSGLVYRVRIGPVKARDEAVSISERVSKLEKRETLVVSYQ